MTGYTDFQYKVVERAVPFEALESALRLKLWLSSTAVTGVAPSASRECGTGMERTKFRPMCNTVTKIM